MFRYPRSYESLMDFSVNKAQELLEDKIPIFLGGIALLFPYGCISALQAATFYTSKRKNVYYGSTD